MSKALSLISLLTLLALASCTDTALPPTVSELPTA